MNSAIAQSYSCHPVSISTQEAEAARHVGTLIRDVLPQLSACHCLALSCPSWSISPGYKRRVIDQWQWRGEKKSREGEMTAADMSVPSARGKRGMSPREWSEIVSCDVYAVHHCKLKFASQLICYIVALRGGLRLCGERGAVFTCFLCVCVF